MNARDVPRHKQWTPDQPSSVPLEPWTVSEPHKKFIESLCRKNKLPKKEDEDELDK